MPTAALILAAGKGTRFKSARAKVLHPLLGRPLVLYPIDLMLAGNADPVVVVVGYQAEEVKAVCSERKVTFVHQTEQKGTGHAVASARNILEGFPGSVLILSADVPLLKPSTLEAFQEAHERARADVSFMWSRVKDPTGYGRLVRGATGYTIVEHKDAGPEQLTIREINVGLYLVKADYLFEALKEIGCDNAQGEYYLPDVINLARNKGAVCRAFEAYDAERVLGVNDRSQLAQAEARLRQELVADLMLEGVTCQDPEAVYLDYGVEVGRDTYLGAGTQLLGRTRVGQNVIIEGNCYIRDTDIPDGAVIRAGSRMVG